MDSSKRFFFRVRSVATGTEIHDRSICHVCIADSQGNLVHEVYIEPEPQLQNTLEPISGIREEDLAKCVPKDVAKREIWKLLDPDCILVGPQIARHIRSLELCQYVHYKNYVDLASLFRSWNRRRERWNWYTMEQVAYAAAIDAPHECKMMSMLFDKFAKDADRRQELKQTLNHLRYTHALPPSPVYVSDPLIQGVRIK